VLYKLKEAGGKFCAIDPQEFIDYSSVPALEKDLEILIAGNLLGTLFEEAPLLPICQERPLQPEADIYALNAEGDLIVFELKRGAAGEDAVLQALRYAQAAGAWTFKELDRRFHMYASAEEPLEQSLAVAHKDAFNLDEELSPAEFNRRQKIVVIGSAADESLIAAVDYWRRQGLLIDFLPYRIYRIDGQHFFEFFSLPYDRHLNPATAKGVLFDTNRTYDEDAIWEMMEKHRVSAYGDNKHLVERLNPKDWVFFSHRFAGLVAAGEVIGPVRKDGIDQQYRDVRFLSAVPLRGQQIKYMPFSDVSKITGQSFFWARTIKVPYLTRYEADLLLQELQKVL